MRRLLLILLVLAAALVAAPAAGATVIVGQVISTTNGGWANNPTNYAYQWEDCDSSGDNCVFVAGATSQSYTVASGDIGHTIRVIITASNATGSGSRTSAQTVVVTSGGIPVANTVAPVESGTATQGSVLTTTNGTWTGSPSFTYQWQDCDAQPLCSDISGATASTYTLAAADVNFTVRAVVTGTAGASTATAASNQSAAVAASGGTGGTWNGTAETGSPSTVCTKYAAPAGATPAGNDSNSGSAAAPWLTIDHMVATLTSGQTGCLEAGTYGSSSDLWVMRTTNVTVTAAPGAAATVQGEPEINFTATGSTISYLNISLNLLQTAGGFCPGQTQITDGVLIDAANATLVHNNVFNSSSSAVRGGGVSIGFNDSGNPGIGGVNVSFNRIHDYGCPNEALLHGMYVNNAHSSTFNDNWIYNGPYNTAGTGPAAIQFFDGHPGQDGPHDNQANGNVFDNVGLGFFLWEEGPLYQHNTTTHNVVTTTTHLGGFSSNDASSTNTFTNSDGISITDGWPCGSTGGCGSVTTSGNIAVDPQYNVANTGSNVPDFRTNNSALAGYGLWDGDIGSTSTAQLGNTNVGSFSGALNADIKRASCYTAGASGTLKALVMHISPNTAGTQAITGVVYSYSGGQPSSLLGFTTELSYRDTAAGWYRMPLTADLSVTSGTTYCIGAITGQTAAVGAYQVDLTGSLFINSNTYTNGPSSPFAISGAITSQAQAMSIYATIQ